jgi:hypothetical protein
MARNRFNAIAFNFGLARAIEPNPTRLQYPLICAALAAPGAIRTFGLESEYIAQNGLLYYFNKADDLSKSTEILMSAGGPRDNYSMLVLVWRWKCW